MDDPTMTLILDRLSHIDRTISEERVNSANSREKMHQKLDATNTRVERMDVRLDALEKAFISMSPTVAEFVNYKARVQGAGVLGQGLWRLGGILLAAAAGAVATWAWIADHFTLKP